MARKKLPKSKLKDKLFQKRISDEDIQILGGFTIAKHKLNIACKEFIEREKMLK
jgi:uncharacterized protein YjbK